jgi:hypothetical protein
MPDDKNDPAPDLQELVRKHRGYSAISPQAWRRWDRANWSLQNDSVLLRLRYERVLGRLLQHGECELHTEKLRQQT